MCVHELYEFICFSESWSFSDWNSAQRFKLVLIFALAEIIFFFSTFLAFIKLSSSHSPSLSNSLDNLRDNLRFLLVRSVSFQNSGSSNLRFYLASSFSIFFLCFLFLSFCRAHFRFKFSSKCSLAMKHLLIRSLQTLILLMHPCRLI